MQKIYKIKKEKNSFPFIFIFIFNDKAQAPELPNLLQTFFTFELPDRTDERIFF